MYAGFNLIFYGVGSKKTLLDAFAQETLRNGGAVRCSPFSFKVFVIAGHHPSTSIKTVLGTILRDILAIAHCPAEPTAQLAAITRALSGESAPHIFVLLHGIDGRGLRGRPNQVRTSLCVIFLSLTLMILGAS